VTLEVRRGGSVEASIEACELVVGSFIESTIDVTVGSDGCSASGTVNFEDITLPLGLTIGEGSLSASVDSSGEFSASGTLSGEITGIGTYSFSAQATNEDLSGTVEITLTQLNIVPNVQVNSGTIRGEFTEDGIDLTGEADVAVRDFTQASLSVSHRYPDAIWGGTGRLDAPPSLQIGGVTVEEAYLNLTV